MRGVPEGRRLAIQTVCLVTILRATGPVYENACHEGNHSMPLILGGACAQERSGMTTRPTRR